MANMFQIPGNIKQQFLPFVLDPNSKLHSNQTASTDLKENCFPQWFSFRQSSSSQVVQGTDNKPTSQKRNGGFGKLQVCPSSLTNVNFGSVVNDDISFKTLYGPDPAQKRSLTVHDIFNQIPGVQIREFLPDTKLDQCLNFFSEMISSVKSIWDKNNDQNKDNKAQGQDDAKKKANTQQMLKNIQAILLHAFDYLTGQVRPSLYENEKGESKLTDNIGLYKKGDDNKLNTYLLTFPFTLYYRLQSCVTTNIYELPCKTADDLMYSSDGKPGWVGGSNSIGVTNTFLSKIPIVGDILKNILGNIQINFMPWWDAEKGAQTAPPEISIKFDLFNDTDKAAMMNFIFVNTIVPNNRWVQYNMFQHSPCLYDVKIEGYNRLFACAGAFQVKGKGQFRTPPRSWVDTLCKNHCNTGGADGDKAKPFGGQIDKELLKQEILQNNLIRIPDVYEVTMTFQSLLPQNFNTYLFTYSQNNKIDNGYDSGNLYQESAFSKLFQAGVTDFITDIKDFNADKEFKTYNGKDWVTTTKTKVMSEDSRIKNDVDNGQ